MTTGRSVWKTSFSPSSTSCASARELRPAMIDRRLVDRAQHPVRHVGRAGNLQEMAAGRVRVELEHGASGGEWRRGRIRRILRCERYHNPPVASAPIVTPPDSVNAPEAKPLVFQPGGAAGDLARRLRGAVAGDVLFDRASRGRYATDASIYQVEPIGVLVPRDRRRRARGVRRLPRACACRCLPRGAGSSQCGQTVGAALVIDHSKHLNRVVAFDRDARTVDRRARHRARRAQRVAEAARPVVSGRRQHVGAGDAGRHGRQQLLRLALDRLRQHGAQRASRSTRSSPTARRRASARRREMADAPPRVRALVDASARDRRARARRDRAPACRRCCAASAATTSTSSIRRASGRTPRDGSVNFAHLLVGSEGTLAWTRALTLKLAPLPRAPRARRRQLPDALPRDGMRAHIVELGPSAVELVDRTMIDLARGNPGVPPGDRRGAHRRAARRSCWSSSPARRATRRVRRARRPRRADGRPRPAGQRGAR